MHAVTFMIRLWEIPTAVLLREQPLKICPTIGSVPPAEWAKTSSLLQSNIHGSNAG